jgi:uncharacterized protein YkwD
MGATRSAAALCATIASLVAAASAPAASMPLLPPLPPLPEPLPRLLGTGPPPQSSAQTAPASVSGVRTSTTTSVAAALQRLVTAQINVVRREHRLPRLAVSAQLARAGQEHAQQLAHAGYFSHDWSDGTPFGSWIRRFYPVGAARRWSAGENLAWAMPDVTAQQAVEMWLASPEHRRILLSKSWRQVGLGVIRADGAGGFYGGKDVVILAAEFGIRR